MLCEHKCTLPPIIQNAILSQEIFRNILLLEKYSTSTHFGNEPFMVRQLFGLSGGCDQIRKVPSSVEALSTDDNRYYFERTTRK